MPNKVQKMHLCMSSAIPLYGQFMPSTTRQDRINPSYSAHVFIVGYLGWGSDNWGPGANFSAIEVLECRTAHQVADLLRRDAPVAIPILPAFVSGPIQNLHDGLVSFNSGEQDVF